MDFALTETQRELAAAARKYLSRTYPVERVAAMSDGDGIDTAAWPELVRQGWLDDDLGMVELGLLAQESGYTLHPTPWWTTVALTAQKEPSTLVTGNFVARDGNGWRLSGNSVLVPDAGTAAHFVVDAGDQLFIVGASDATVREYTSLDRLRRMYEVRLDDAPARPLAPVGRDRAAALLACEAVGVAARAMDFAVDYAKTREQFGRPIGSFQAVAHQLAEGYVELELARSLALRAAWLVGDQGDSDERISALACAVISGRQAAVRCCELAMQTLGGMGVTWEHPLHLWFRRALWLESFALPDPYAAVAAAILIRETR
ncbi:MAG TPA: acyl-CoA dehydrogenase [Micromonosporaceae bacterium]|nr:acyl-CoA dehydrogenase [Micromonosporaceae bacterium]